MKYEGPVTHEIRNTCNLVIAVVACLLIAACDNADSGKKTASPPATAAPASTQAEPEASTMADTPEQTVTEDTSEETQSQESTTAVTETETADTGGEQQVAEAETQEREPLSGRDVYNNFCVICHRAGMNGAPKYGDKRIWAQRVKKGKETLYKDSVNGIRAMPPKGGIAWLTDQEVHDAVDYMVNGSGGWGDAE